MQNLHNPHRSTAYIVVLTLILGALQLAWSTEFSEATPFLLSLGISKKILSLVWLAGPLSGTIGQPIVGMLSDRCMSNLGKRRIFIMVGCFATIISLNLLSHSQNIVTFILRPFNLNEETLDLYVIIFACLGIYVLDFSIQVIQASSRALIVDVVPTDQQQLANAWAARMIGIFNLIGFWLGSLKLIDLFPNFGNTQFEILGLLVSILMIIITCSCCLLIRERNPNTDITLITQRKLYDDKLLEIGIDPNNPSIKLQLINFFKQILFSFNAIPKQVKTVCYAQLFAWIGYFPLLFYTTSYVGELYLYEKGYPNPKFIPPDLKKQLMDESTRVGTHALLANSIVTLIVVILLPEILQDCKIKSINLKNLWIISHIVFIFCTFMTFFISTSKGAIYLFALTGIPWGAAVWLPFSLISEEISRIKDIIAVQIYYKEQSLNGDTDLIEDDEEILNSKNKIYCTPVLIDYYDRIEYDSGILLALHNVFVSAPQMISSLMSSVLFTIFHSANKNADDYDSSLAWIFRFGGLMCFGAWYVSTKVKTNDQLYKDDKFLAVSGNF